jgi:ribokinase
MSASPVQLVAIGDIAWDILVRPSGEFVWGSDVYGTVDLLAGGSSANVAVWARRLGALVALVGKIGDDRLGDLMHAHLDEERVASCVTRVPGGATTRIAIVVRPDGERSFVTDHTHPLQLAAADLPCSLLDGTDVVFLNGYSIFMAGGVAFATAFLAEARARGVPIAFDPSSFALVARYGGTRLLDELGPLDVLLANEEELNALADGGTRASLLQRSRLVVVKQGARGATLMLQDEPGGSPREVPAAALRVEAVDTTGAGDAFDAAFLVDYFTHGDVKVALAAANLLGARVASQLGAQTR